MSRFFIISQYASTLIHMYMPLRPLCLRLPSQPTASATRRAATSSVRRGRTGSFGSTSSASGCFAPVWATRGYPFLISSLCARYAGLAGWVDPHLDGVGFIRIVSRERSSGWLRVTFRWCVSCLHFLQKNGEGPIFLVYAAMVFAAVMSSAQTRR